MNTCPAEAESFHAVDVAELKVAFHNFANAPKNSYKILTGKSERPKRLLWRRRRWEDALVLH
jgi:hypothetical protein